MDIAALSMGLSQMKVAQQAGISVMKLAMEAAQGQTAELVQMLETGTQGMEASVTPHLGANIDVSV